GSFTLFTYTTLFRSMAAPIPLLPKAKDHSNISLARTWVSNSAPVIVRGMSKSFSVAMEMVVITTTRAGRIEGMVICQNICQAFRSEEHTSELQSRFE